MPGPAATRDLPLRMAELGGMYRPDSGSLGARIRAHRLVPYQAVIGAREAAAGEAALRLRDGRRVPARPAGEVLAGIGECVAAHDTQLREPAAPDAG